MLGEEYLMILVPGMCYWCYNKEIGRKLTLALSGSVLAGSFIKRFVLRLRPYMEYDTVRCIRAAHPDEDIMDSLAQGFSFPSQRSIMSVAIYGTFARHIKRIATTLLAVVLPLCIGIARAYLGIHYPTDVLFRWVLGAILMLVLGWLEKNKGYKIAFAALLIFFAIGFFFCRESEFYTSYGITVGFLTGYWYEEKYMRFENAKHWQGYIFRPIFGLVIFFALSELLKLLAQAVIPEDAMIFALIFRAFRYAFSIFVVMGVYPRLFRFL